jgi:hypothetical protein
MYENMVVDLTCEDLPPGFPGGTPKALKIVQGGNYLDAGTLILETYTHAMLILHVACWISSVFAINDF